MDIRKHIIILCLLCCHALGVMADGGLVPKYTSISAQDAVYLFNLRNEPRIKVTGVSYGDYALVGKGSNKQLVAASNNSKEHCFALKVKCDEPWNFTFYIQEVGWDRKEIYYAPTYNHTLIVDGHVKTKMEPETVRNRVSKVWEVRKVWDQLKMCELSAGEHEIVIMSNYIGNSEDPRLIQFKSLSLHAHKMVTEAQRPAFCGQIGYTKRSCKYCGHRNDDTYPMPATKHEFGSELTSQGSCMIPSSLFRECSHCGISEFNIKKHKSLTHKFRDGRCVNEGCELKMPVTNEAGIYQVGDAYELRGLAEQISVGYIPRDCNIDLTADIIYPENLAHYPIGTTEHPFAGTFDGHGHRIAGMQSAIPTDMTGLFGVVEGTPRRLAVIANVIIDSSSNLQGTNMIGAIAGRADYCDIMRCVSRAKINGYNDVGGIVGYSERECHVIDCAGLGIVNSKENGGILSGTLRRGYIMDSYGSGSLANGDTEPALVPTVESSLRHCFQLDAKVPMTGVTPFSSAQLSDGTLARMLCEKNGRDLPAHWQQGATDGCPMPVFVALTDRPASVIQTQAARVAMYENDNENSSTGLRISSYEDDGDNDNEEDEEGEWFTFSPESGLTEGSPEDVFVFYDEADSTLNDFICYVSTTFRNVPTMPMFAAMEGGDATESDMIYCKKDSTVILEYNYTIDGWLYSLIDATKQYTMPDSVVHLEHYTVEGNEYDCEFLMTGSMVFRPDNSGYEEKVSYGVSTRVMDWNVSQTEDEEPVLNYYYYDEDGQQHVDFYSCPLYYNEDDGDDYLLPIDMDYTLDENDRLKDLFYVHTDSITGEKYNIGGQYFIYDEQGELVQIVSYEPVEPYSREMRQTEYCTISVYNADDTPAAIIPIEQLQPGTLDKKSTRTSCHVYDIHGNLVSLTNDADALKSLPKGVYITRGRKILVY